MNRRALVRRPSPRLAEGLITHIARTPVDLVRAQLQWEEYVAAFRAEGWETVEVPPADDCPDAAFVEDTVVVYGDLAVIARPGADQRRPETAGTEETLAGLGYRIARIEEPGTLDGGDVLKHDGTVWVGLGGRTNQSGVARGYFTLEELAAVGEHLEAVVRAAGGVWGGFFACPHLPDGVNEYAIDCDCRKPASGMIREAAEYLGVKPEDSWFIGDTWMDMAAGHAVGCRTILVGREWRDGGSYPPEARPDHAVPDLAVAARITIGYRDEVEGMGETAELVS